MAEAKLVRIRGEWAMSVSKSTCVGKARTNSYYDSGKKKAFCDYQDLYIA